jgi:DNA-binding IclR family transcriptional regulator
VRAVQRAFDLLALVGASATAATLSELARDSALPVSTVARLLATLEKTEFVQRDAEGRYRPGLRLVQVGLSSLRRFSIYEMAEAHLRHLSDITSETANLAVRADAENAIYLRQVVSPRSIHHASWLGRMLPLKRTAVGAALMGLADGKGYVARSNTLDPDVTAIAAPVRGPNGQIVAAFSITGPSFRMNDRVIQSYGSLLVAQANRASAELGAPTAPAAAAPASRRSV